MTWQQQSLGEVFSIARGGSPRPIQQFLTDDVNGLNWVMISDASGGSKYITRTQKRIKRSGLPRTRMVHEGDFLLTNSMSFGRPYIMKISGCIHDGWLVLSPRDPKAVSSDYFYYLLSSETIYRQFSRLAAGAVVKNLNTKIVQSVRIAFPPLPEQKRIAAILDAADALRAKRRESLDQLDALVQSTFLDMFGDPVENPMGWETHLFGSVAGPSLRNGLSPSAKGSVEGEVLTLSAVTSGRFIGSFRKRARFDRLPSKAQLITPDTFLICRGNGNPDLVGVGVFPTPDWCAQKIIFPDTVIAATPSRNLASSRFLQTLWASQLVRDQILRGARTTNGTYKINQKTLAAIELPLPPLKRQESFAQIVEAIERQKARYRAHLAELDQLFGSLQQRAFAGEL